VAEPLVVGVDFGTLSGRAVVVRVRDGAELGSAVSEYWHGVIDDVLPATGHALAPDWALQVPSDYLDVLRDAVPAALAEAGADPADVIGIATDFTACTMVPATVDGTPLCELQAFKENPHATSSCGGITRRSRRRTASTSWPGRAVRSGCPDTAG